MAFDLEPPQGGDEPKVWELSGFGPAAIRKHMKVGDGPVSRNLKLKTGLVRVLLLVIVVTHI